MNAADFATYLGGITAAGAILGVAGRVVTRPVRRLANDLGPLTDRNSDGDSVFDEMRKQQKADSAALQQLAAEFPKNGVPARSTVDALKLDLATMLTRQAAIAADVAEVKAAHRAHVRIHREGFPTQRRDET